jgi:hypothetical protein
VNLSKSTTWSSGFQIKRLGFCIKKALIRFWRMPSSRMGLLLGLVKTDVSEESIPLFYTGRGNFLFALRKETVVGSVWSQFRSCEICGGQSVTEAYQFSFHRLLHTNHFLRCKAGTMGQSVGSVSQHPEKLEKKI